MTSPASNIIEKCGGVKAVAEMCGVDVSQVHRWKYPRSRGGTGGQVPTRHQKRLMQAARRLGIDLQPNDFFDTLAALPPATATP